MIARYLDLICTSTSSAMVGVRRSASSPRRLQAESGHIFGESVHLSDSRVLAYGSRESIN
jgi:hypothetical protein